MKKSNSSEIFSIGKEIISNKKFQIGLTIILFLIILISSTSLRLANLPLLVDKTTGEYNFADPDAYYMYRVAQTYLERDGDLSGIDNMRNPGMNVTYNQEILSPVLVNTYKILKVFNPEITLNTVDAYYPAIAFSISLIIFFVLTSYISRSKFVGLVASALLAYHPVYLGRTTAGISSHESLGMVFFFLTLLIFVFSLNSLNKSWKTNIALGILTGVSLALSFVSWSGASSFALMAFPIATMLFYLFGIPDESLELKRKLIVFTILWALFSGLSPMLFNYSPISFFSKFLTSFGLVTPFTILLMAVDFCLIRYLARLEAVQSKYRLLFSILITVMLGIVGLFILGKNPFAIIYNIYHQLIYPFGVERVALTVAYFAQPYLTDIISQYQKTIFWLGFFGMVVIGVMFSKEIKELKYRLSFVFIWSISLICMMFSRFSPGGVFNGTNTLSKAVYILSILILMVLIGWFYFNKKFKIEARTVFIFAWMIIMIFSMRSAVRVIFIIYTFMAAIIPLFIFKVYEYSKEVKDNTAKYALRVISVFSLIFVLISLFGNPFNPGQNPGMYTISKYSAQNTGPIANEQWQYAMEWTRNNTLEEDRFIHWWDYGYLVQTIGKRTTILDGGNANAYGNHMFARYVLTTTKPDTALSFMKSQGVSYLLIDPTDLGKYGAYSKIGSDINWDRYSQIPTVVSDQKQIVETTNGTRRIYQGTTFVDEDISYKNIFLPGPTYDKIGTPSPKAYFIGITLESSYSSQNTIKFKQPLAVFVYNNKQHTIPMRYVFYQGKMYDFGSGLEATFMIVPQISQTSNGQIQVDQTGAGIYLSPKVNDGLFAQLYLMGDPNNRYPTIMDVHSEDDYVVRVLKSQGLNLGEFIYFQGLRSPLKIWKVTYSENVKDNYQFRLTSGEFAAWDNLTMRIE